MSESPNEESAEGAREDQEIQTPTPSVSFRELLGTESPLVPSLDRLGFQLPTPIQQQAIPEAQSGRDLIVQAQTGSGKTLAYVIPLLEFLMRSVPQESPKAVHSLVIVPTRELALQVVRVIDSLEQGVRPISVIGGEDMSAQIRKLERDARIVVGTPGRILDLLHRKALRLHACKYFVLDEADEMLSMGFLEDVRAILSRLPDVRQGMFVSATITPRVEMLAHSFLTRPQSLLLDTVGEDMPPVEHFYCEVGGDIMAKPNALCDIIETQRPRSAIIFCNTKSDTQLVEALLRRRGFDARRINSDLSQSARNRVMKQIRNGELQLLVATDIAARGIDVSQIELVVNYALHEQPEIYVHRTGRTGRAGHAGRAISLVGPRDFGSFHFLTKVLEVHFEKLPLPSDKDVCDARLAHLYEIVRLSQLEPKERDLVLARKLLSELGEIAEPSEELETFVSKLCRYTIEHYIEHEAKALDEEEGESHPRSPGRRDEESEWEGGGTHNRRDRGRERDQQHSRNRRDHQHSRREGRDDRRRGDNRDHSRDHRRDGGGNRDQRDRHENHQYGRGRSDDRHQRRDNRGRHDRNDNRRGRDDSRHFRGERARPSTPRPPRPVRLGRNVQEVRLYIGQGLEHGFSAQTFANLAKEFADVDEQDLRNLSIREHYGFVDVYTPQAEALMNNLNGIEYNSMPLPVEFAAALTREQLAPEQPESKAETEQ